MIRPMANDKPKRLCKVTCEKLDLTQSVHTSVSIYKLILNEEQNCSI